MTASLLWSITATLQRARKGPRATQEVGATEVHEAVLVSIRGVQVPQVQRTSKVRCTCPTNRC